MKYSLLDIVGTLTIQSEKSIDPINSAIIEILEDYEKERDLYWALHKAALCGFVLAAMNDGALALSCIKPE